MRKEPLFADRTHSFVFFAYVLLFVSQGLLVKASMEPDGSFAYNTTTVVLLTECIKLVLACSWYLHEQRSVKQLFNEIRQNGKIFVLYLIPAFLYCLYNNLSFKNLQHYDPTSYFLLLNFRTVFTGIIFQVLYYHCPISFAQLYFLNFFRFRFCFKRN